MLNSMLYSYFTPNLLFYTGQNDTTPPLPGPSQSRLDCAGPIRAGHHYSRGKRQGRLVAVLRTLGRTSGAGSFQGQVFGAKLYRVGRLCAGIQPQGSLDAIVDATIVGDEFHARVEQKVARSSSSRGR